MYHFKNNIMAAKKSKLVEIKTKPSIDSVELFLGALADEQKRKDCFVLVDLMRKATGEEPVLWSNTIIGFGNKRFKSPNTGREVDWLLIGLAPRKANISLHLMLNVNDHQLLLNQLGKHKTGVGCLYFNKLADIDLTVLDKLIKLSVEKSNSQ